MTTVIVGADRILLARLLALRGALKLEIRGMKRKGRPASVIVREAIDSRTRSKTALLDELERYILERRAEL